MTAWIGFDGPASGSPALNGGIAGTAVSFDRFTVEQLAGERIGNLPAGAGASTRFHDLVLHWIRKGKYPARSMVRTEPRSSAAKRSRRGACLGAVSSAT